MLQEASKDAQRERCSTWNIPRRAGVARVESETFYAPCFAHHRSAVEATAAVVVLFFLGGFFVGFFFDAGVEVGEAAHEGDAAGDRGQADGARDAPGRHADGKDLIG